MNQVLTGHPSVDAISQIHFEGNVVCNSWRTHIQYSNKRGTYTHHLAVMLLADIVYWYRASEIRDEETGATIGWKKKFKDEKLQKSYKSLAIQMGASLEQIKDACKLLTSLNLIQVSFETVPRPNDTALGNVMFIDVYPDQIAAISYKERLNKTVSPPMGEIAHRDTSELPPTLSVKSPIAPGEITHSTGRNHPDITEITPEITPETDQDSLSPTSLSALTDKERETFEKFVREERRRTKGEEIDSMKAFLRDTEYFREWWTKFLSSSVGRAAKQEATTTQYDWDNDPRTPEWSKACYENGHPWVHEVEAEREIRNSFFWWWKKNPNRATG